MNVLKLFQLADSMLPTGGFVFSSGLESMARQGWLRSSGDMYDYLNTQLDQACTAELPFINSIFRKIDCLDEVFLILNYYDAFSQVEVIRSASIRQARSWLDILVEIEPEAMKAVKMLEDFKGTPHYTPVFALSLSLLDIPLKMIGELYLYMILRDQISAAVRLGLTGPSKGAAVLSEMLKEAEKTHEVYSKLEYSDAYRSAPILEIAQANHTELYTKLFQN